MNLTDNIEEVARLEIEEAITGWWILQPKTIVETIEATDITPQWFKEPTCQLIASYCINSEKTGNIVNSSSIAKHLTKKTRQDYRTNFNTLIRIQKNPYPSSRIIEYCKQLKKLQAEKNIDEAKSVLTNEGDATVRIDEANSLLEDAEKYLIDEKIYSTRNILEEITDDWANPVSHRQCLTKHVKLDEKIHGMVDSRLYILAARPGIGKTSLALDFAYNFVAQGRPVLFVSLEMEKTELIKRMLSIKSKVSTYDMDLEARNNQREDISNSIYDQVDILASFPFYVSDEPLAGFANIRSMFRKIVEETGEKPIIFVDYLQLIYLSGRHNSRYEEVTRISRQLKLMAKKLDTVVVCLSQLNRAVESRQDQKAKLSDLRDSGSIEQDADVVILLSALEEDEGEGIGRDVVVLDVAKNRHGGGGEIQYVFHGAYTCFEEL